MKLLLSSFTRQLIILLLLMALMWEPRPAIGPDGRMPVQISIHSSSGTSTNSGIPFHPSALVLTFPDRTTREITSIQFCGVKAINHPKWWLKTVKSEKWLAGYLPDQLRYEGYQINMRLLPNDWDLLENARKKGATVGIRWPRQGCFYPVSKN